jgi:hypothetical protein
MAYVIGHRHELAWLVAQSTAQVIRGDAAVSVSQCEDQAPPVEGPRGVAVDEQQAFWGWPAI